MPVDDIFELIRTKLGGPGRTNGKEEMFSCPWHGGGAEKHPSLAVNAKKRTWFCGPCRAEGNEPSAGSLSTLAAKLGIPVAVKREVSKDEVALRHKALMENESARSFILRRKGISEETVVKYQLGFDGERYWIPVLLGGTCVNARRYKPDSKRDKMLNYAEGFGVPPRLYPEDALAGQDLVLCEGEIKALLLRQMGFNAASGTGGAGTFNEGWVRLLAGKDVTILYDADDAGKKGAIRAATMLKDSAKSIRVANLAAHLPAEAGHKDITDFVVDLGHAAEDVKRILDDAVAFELPAVSATPKDATEYPVSFKDSVNARFGGKNVIFRGHVATRDIYPFLIPKKVRFICRRGMGKMCDKCPVAERCDLTVDLPVYDEPVLKLVDVPTDKQTREVLKLCKVPTGCVAHSMEILERHNIETFDMTPPVDETQGPTEGTLSDSEADGSMDVRHCYLSGLGISDNAEYRVHGLLVADAPNQRATFVVKQVDPSRDDLSAFAPSKKQLEELSEAFYAPPGEVRDVLDRVYTDLEANVTRIYARRDMHEFIDLCIHSPLWIEFNGERARGWTDMVIVGDTRQGKSLAAIRMLGHYGVGERLACNKMTRAGLFGGLDQSTGRWRVQWGAIPRNDRRLLLLDEAQELDPELMPTLNDSRSSGKAEVAGIATRVTSARTRLLWIANPPRGRRMDTFGFGVEAVRMLYHKQEVISRFDAAMIVAAGEVPGIVLNLAEDQRPTAEARATSELCHRLIMWAWSRKSHQIHYTKVAQALILDLAGKFGEKYSSAIPLIEGAEYRWKLARLSASLAARTFSTDDLERLVVRQDHVEEVAAFLDRIYMAPAMAYDRYSSARAKDAAPPNMAKLNDALGPVPHLIPFLEQMLAYETFTVSDVSVAADLDGGPSKQLVAALLRARCVRKIDGGKYVKLPAFITFCKEFTSANGHGAPEPVA